jgi:hypothetical protein
MSAPDRRALVIAGGVGHRSAGSVSCSGWHGRGRIPAAAAGDYDLQLMRLVSGPRPRVGDRPKLHRRRARRQRHGNS